MVRRHNFVIQMKMGPTLKVKFNNLHSPSQRSEVANAVPETPTEFVGTSKLFPSTMLSASIDSIHL